MERLRPAQARAVLEGYAAGPAFFPLIAAVLAGDQDGAAYAGPGGPQQVYVEHAFGFAQVLGEPSDEFDAALEDYLLRRKAFAAPKVRLYTPRLPAFLATPQSAPLRSERQRFKLAAPAADVPAPGRLSCLPVTRDNFEAVERAFGIAQRFWRSAEDFIDQALPTVAWADGKPAAICYAAAVAAGRAEIDVLALPEARRQGAARCAVLHFLRRCREQNVVPSWDCFTNNAASMQLCRSAGFVAAAPPYPFFTISK